MYKKRISDAAPVQRMGAVFMRTEKCEDKKDESEEYEETDGIQYSDNDINNFINKAKKIMLERYCELENGSLRKDDEERDNIRRYILQKYPTVVEKYKSHHNR